MLATDPGPGISAWPVNDVNMMHLQAQIQGPQGSPYQGGLYSLTIDIPDRYPFEPPRVRFTTPIYHPNIDSDGRICLDTLKMQPHGSWSPSVNINTLLLTIRVLMSNPNPDDGLVPDITEEYRRDLALWKRKALEHTRLNAIPVIPSQSPTKNVLLGAETIGIICQGAQVTVDVLDEDASDGGSNNDSGSDCDESDTECGEAQSNEINVKPSERNRVSNESEVPALKYPRRDI